MALGQSISKCLELIQAITGPVAAGFQGQMGAAAFGMVSEQWKSVKDAEKDIQKLQSNLQAIKAVVSDVEQRQVVDYSVQNWLEKLKNVLPDIVSLLNEWFAASNRSRSVDQDRDEETRPPLLKKVCFGISKLASRFTNFPIHEVGIRHNFASRIKELNERLDIIADEKSKYSFKTGSFVNVTPKSGRCRPRTTSFVDMSKLYGRDREKEALKCKLLSERIRRGQDGRNLDVVSVVGSQGIGKTTLAQIVYNDNNVRSYFEKRIWVCVSDNFDEIRVAKAIIEALDDRGVNLTEMESLLQRLDNSAEGKRFLLVLDDVWNEDAMKWEPFKEALKNGARGSRVLVTTRDEEVAKMMGVDSESRITLEELMSREVASGTVPGLITIGG